MPRPLVTIVTPSYNQGEFIRATIESVLAQDYPAVEYIIMDGASTDHTASIAAEYAGRLTWISEKDRGQCHAINKGFRMARGEIVAWLNSDDILLRGAVTRAVAAFDRMPAASVIYGEGYLMDREGNFTRRFPATEPFNLWKLVYLSDYILQQSAFFRRAAVEEIGGLDESLEYALDWDLFIRLGKRFGLHYVPEYFGALREHPQAKTFAGGVGRAEEIRRVLERHTGLERAPGYWIYALDTYQRLLSDRLRNRGPRWLRAPGRLLGAAVWLASSVVIMLILRHAQGLYADRWASARLNWMLPEGRGDVVIRGAVPPESRLAGGTLTARVAGRQAGQWRLPAGDFELRFRPPAGQPGPLLLELEADRYKRELRLRQLSLRRLAFILHSLDWDPEA